MLANGIKLEYKEKDSLEGLFTELKGLKEVPEIGNDPEKVENTTLGDKIKQYEFGVGDAGDLSYVFKYENKGEESPYRIMRKAAEAKKVLTFKETFPDGTAFEFDSQVSVKLTGGGINTPVDFVLDMALQSEIKVTDPIL